MLRCIKKLIKIETIIKIMPRAIAKWKLPLLVSREIAVVKTLVA